ncbi:MAG: hypothetical protein K2K26_07625 [Muribaculaceae bacterium]|nr:hypothetical protein [Muribaculaceae bacterium]
MALTITGCTDKRTTKVKTFADRFAQYVSRNEIDSILSYYPAAEYADKIDLTYNPDSISVKDGEKENTYYVTFDNGLSMLVTLLPNGNITVNETKGLFKYPESKILFARKLGALHSDMTDEKLAKVMINVDNLSTELFNEYVASRKGAIKNLGPTITVEVEYGYQIGEGYYTLKNTTDQPIGGDEYSTTWQYDYMHMGYEDHHTEIKPGKDIPGRGSVQIPFKYSFHQGESLIAITMNTPSQDSFFKNYEPRGDEYSNYVKAHGEDPGKIERLSYGPYKLAGKLGGKYAIHLNLDKGMKHGSYYYDRYGTKNTLELSVKAFNDRTGELTLEETNDKGEVTGTFIGTLTKDTYTGKMTSYEGKTYSFTLKVVNVSKMNK